MSAPIAATSASPTGQTQPRRAPAPMQTARAIPIIPHGPRCSGPPLSPRREAVGEFPGSDDFLYINDKKAILRWAISVSGAPLRPPAALL